MSMTMQLPPLDHLRAFEAAARHLSFKMAADEMNVTPAAVGQRIRSLENILRTKLFERQIRQIHLTPEGALLLEDVSHGLKRLHFGIKRLQAQIQNNVLKISATNSFTELVLLPKLADFTAIAPNCDVRIISTDEWLDPSSFEADVCIRFGAGQYSGHNVEKLGVCHYAPVCSPKFGNGAQAMSQLEELLNLPLIEETWPNNELAAAPSWSSWFSKRGVEFSPKKPMTNVSLEAHAIRAALSGQGVALARTSYLDEQLSNGTLIELFAPSGRELSVFENHLVWREDETSPLVHQFLDWARMAFAGTAN